MPSNFVPNKAAIDAYLHSPSGPVWQHLNSFGRQVEAEAKRRSPVDTGLLRASIWASRPGLGPSGLALLVGSPVHYAIIVHQGHGRIFPKKPGGRLKFQVPGVGTVYARSTRPTVGRPYIWDAVVEVNNRLPADRRFRLTRGELPRT